MKTWFGIDMDLIDKEAKSGIDRLNKAGLVYPLDHIAYTFILWVIVYIPTKLIYLILSICYGTPQKKQDT